MSLRTTLPITVALLVALAAPPATAQVIGTFSWQTQPYCNVVTVGIVQQGGLYQLVGSDNLCGAGQAPVTGTAVPAGSNVAMGLTVALPSGRAAHLSATVLVTSASGSWSDADGNSGAFALNGAAGGTPRPAPASAAGIAASQLSPAIYGGTGGAATVARSDHDHDARYYTRAEIDATKTAEAMQTLDSLTGFSYVPESVLSLTQTITTTRAGHLWLSKLFTGSTTCTNAGDARLFYVVLDGVPVRSSAVLINDSSVVQLRLSGVTSTVVPAGAHSVAVGRECYASSTVQNFINTAFTNTSVLVLP